MHSSADRWIMASWNLQGILFYNYLFLFKFSFMLLSLERSNIFRLILWTLNRSVALAPLSNAVFTITQLVKMHDIENVKYICVNSSGSVGAAAVWQGGRSLVHRSDFVHPVSTCFTVFLSQIFCTDIALCSFRFHIFKNRLSLSSSRMFLCRFTVSIASSNIGY